MTNRPWLALQVTLGAQTLASFVMGIAPVLAPVVAPQLGLHGERVGVFNGTAYLCAMVSGLAMGGWIERVGAVRFTQFVLVMTAIGGLLTTAGTAPALIAASVLIGIGYGAINPAAAAILGRHAPPNAPGLFFALKQCGVPAGVALAGLLIPVSYAAFGWRASVLLSAAACLLAAAMLSPVRAHLEPAQRGAAPAGRTWASSLLLVMREPPLRRLSLMCAAYAMAQLGLLTFSVSLLVRLGLDLGTAAALLAASQAAAVFMRITMGHAADRWFTPRALLGVQGLFMGAGCAALAFLPQSPPVWVAALAMVFAGGTLMGWNGVFFAELVRVVPRDKLAQSSGATQFFMFGGSMLGPYLFSQLLAAGGSYAGGYLLLGLIGALAGLAMLRAPRSA